MVAEHLASNGRDSLGRACTSKVEVASMQNCQHYTVSYYLGKLEGPTVVQKRGRGVFKSLGTN
jgi:hypothetical protein